MKVKRNVCSVGIQTEQSKTLSQEIQTDEVIQHDAETQYPEIDLEHDGKDKDFKPSV